MYLNIVTSYHLMKKIIMFLYVIQTLISLYLYILEYEYLRKFLHDMNHIPTWDIYIFCDEFLLFQCQIFFRKTWKNVFF